MVFLVEAILLPMEERKWGNLITDCLVEVFKRVGLETLVTSIPLVCKSWHKATFEPKCWESLVFPDIRFSKTRNFAPSNSLLWDAFPSLSFARFVVSHSCRSTTNIVLPGTCPSQVLELLSDKCPQVKFLGLSLDLLYQQGAVVANVIGKWRNLEVLSVGNCYMLKEILTQIRLHCKNFVGLIFCSSWIGGEEASSICCILPKIKTLSFRKAHLKRRNLLMIMESCKELQVLELRDCKGFDYDDEIMKLASKIHNFRFTRSNSNRELNVS